MAMQEEEGSTGLGATHKSRREDNIQGASLGQSSDRSYFVILIPRLCVTITATYHITEQGEEI